MGEQAESALRSDSMHGDIPPGAELRRVGRMSLGRIPKTFDLHRTALSHGWCSLVPTAYDGTRRALHRTLLLPDAGPLTVTVTQRADGGLTASWGRTEGSCADRVEIKTQLRHMLALDSDVSELHETCARVDAFAWVPGCGAGRLLRSPSVFEDLVKTLATTNCSWALTESMCRRFVEELGAVGPAGERAFPTPEAIVAAGVDRLRTDIRTGYRAPSFHALAEAVASGALNPDRWLDPAIADDVVHRELLALRGFGPYAADGMLGLLGRPRGLAIDSWVRAKLPRIVGVTTMTDAEIAARYEPFGRWAGSALWLELTRDWFE